MEKIEVNTQNIHHEFRSTHLAMDKRLNSLINDNIQINNTLMMMQNELPFDTYLTTDQFLSKSAYLRSRKSSKLKLIQNLGKESSRKLFRKSEMM